MKQCSRCGETKPLDEFSPDSRYSAKRASRCRPCNVLAALEYRARNRNKVDAYQREWRERNREDIRTKGVAKHRQIKADAMAAYGGFCACCGESELAFLAIDHIDDDGAEHRRTGVGSGRKLYEWLKKESYPAGFQVLCFNCNFAKSNGGCPHQKGVTALCR